VPKTVSRSLPPTIHRPRNRFECRTLEVRLARIALPAPIGSMKSIRRRRRGARVPGCAPRMRPTVPAPWLPRCRTSSLPRTVRASARCGCTSRCEFAAPWRPPTSDGDHQVRRAHRLFQRAVLECHVDDRLYLARTECRRKCRASYRSDRRRIDPGMCSEDRRRRVVVIVGPRRGGAICLRQAARQVAVVRNPFTRRDHAT